MKRSRLLLLAFCLSTLIITGLSQTKTARAVDPAPIPIGYDAYLQWDHWPYQRIGQRAYMRSTYDRRGGNEAADASHFLYQLADDNNVALDVAQSGVLYFARQNHWHGSPWRWFVDGTEHVVQESSTATRDESLKESIFMPPEQFPSPLALTWTTTKGAALNWVPIEFNQSLRLGYTWTCYGTGYFIYHQWVPGTPLTRPLQPFSSKSVPPQQVIDLFNSAGNDPLPAADSPQAQQMQLTEQHGTFQLPAAGTVDVCSLTEPGIIRGLNFSVARDEAIDFGRTRLRITWDDRSHASIDAPLALFFGAGTLYNRDDREYLVKAFPVNIRYDADRVYLGCYLPMPFFDSARIELVSGSDQGNSIDVQWSVRTVPLKESPERLGYLHATYRDYESGDLGHDLVLLDTRDIEGSTHWSGSFIGTSFTFSDRSVLTTLEGDPRFFFDDSQTPQGQGTGTEEWGGGGDYWGGQNMTLPFAGHPCGARNPAEAKNAEDNIQSAYRFLLADQMPFGKNARICLEHGGENLSTEHYRTVTYWYGRPGSTIIKTDTLQIGDSASEDAHQYDSPKASDVYTITSRYELGIDTIPASATPDHKPIEVYPAHTDNARKTTGTSEFVMQINPSNVGVMLRRKLDYSFPNQRAAVFIQNKDGKTWSPAGTWYTAGSNTCVYSRPKEELGATQHNVQTSNRQFRDDEFLLPKALTAGRSSIRIRVQFDPTNIPLFPGHPLAEQAWSEIRYDAWSFIAP